jgi:heptosyltransferase-3/putative inorganic carbon (HCO3(-)) transporter
MAIPIIGAAVVIWKRRVHRILSTCAGIVAFAAQASSYTRAGWVGMMAEGVVLGFFTARRQVVIWVLGAALFVGAVLFTLSQWGYQRDTMDPWTLIDARVGVWKLQLEEIVHHPLVGIGYGSKTFMLRFSGYRETEKAEGSHSTFLMVATGSGIPAVALLLWLMIRTVRSLMYTAKQEIDNQKRVFMIAVAVMIVGFATRNIFDYMFAGSLAYLYWLLIATAFPRSLSNGIEYQRF